MKWYWKLLIALVVLLILAIISMDTITTRYVDSNVRRLQKQVEGSYNFDYKSLNVSILQKRVVLKDFEFESVIDSLNTNNKLTLHLDKLILHFSTYQEVLIEGKLHIIRAQLKRPIIDYGLKKKLSHENVDDSSLEPQPEAENEDEDVIAEKNKEKFINTIIFDKIKITDGIADIYHLEEADKKLLHVEDLDLTVSKLNVDLDQRSISKMLKTEDLDIAFSNITTNELKNHDLSIDKIKFKLSEKKLKIKGIHFVNKDKPKVFASKNKYRSPWFDMTFKEIIVDVNPWHIYNKGVLYIKKIQVDEAQVEIYNDITLELTEGKKLLPPGDIRNIPIPLMIDSLIVLNGKFKYLHKDKSDKPGMFGLDDLHVKASNITNIDYKVEQEPLMNLAVDAKIWNSGKLHADFNIDLLNTKDIVYVKGWVKDMPLKKAEKMIKPLYGVEIHSGHLDLLSYDLVMNDDIGKGKMKFDYRDLKVDIKKLKEKNETATGEHKSSKFLNFLANEAILTNNIPGVTKNYIEDGLMIFDRTKNKPIFDLYWKSMQIGIMDIVVADAFFQAETNYNKKIQKKEKQEIKETKQEESEKKKKKRKKKK